jgi:hypothetical protein
MMTDRDDAVATLDVPDTTIDEEEREVLVLPLVSRRRAVLKALVISDPETTARNLPLRLKK